MSGEKLRLNELRSVPVWGLVAIAARAARRVQPIVTHYTSGLQAIKNSVEMAISAAEDAAQDWHVDPSMHLALQRADSSVPIIHEFIYRSSASAVGVAESSRPNAMVMHALRAARNAGAMVFEVGRYLDSPAEEARIAVSDCAFEAILESESALRLFVSEHEYAQSDEWSRTQVTIMKDVRRLVDRSIEKKWTDDSIVSPAFFGSMWPDGAPTRWPVVGSKSFDRELPQVEESIYQTILKSLAKSQKLRILLRPGNATEIQIGRFILALSAYHKALGGSGLTIDREDHVYEPNGALVKQ